MDSRQAENQATQAVADPSEAMERLFPIVGRCEEAYQAFAAACQVSAQAMAEISHGLAVRVGTYDYLIRSRFAPGPASCIAFRILPEWIVKTVVNLKRITGGVQK